MKHRQLALLLAAVAIAVTVGLIRRPRRPWGPSEYGFRASLALRDGARSFDLTLRNEAREMQAIPGVTLVLTPLPFRAGDVMWARWPLGRPTLFGQEEYRGVWTLQDSEQWCVERNRVKGTCHMVPFSEARRPGVYEAYVGLGKGFRVSNIVTYSMSR